MGYFISRRWAMPIIASAVLLSGVAGCGTSGGTGSQANEQLFRAATAGNVVAIEGAIAAGADVNAVDYSKSTNGRRALNYAALNNRPDAIRALVAAGAQINLANNTGFTPLHHAAEAGSVDAARALLELGADKTLRHGGGLTPLQVADESNHPEVADVLR